MKRFWMFAGVFALCTLLTGCGQETREGLVTDTVARMKTAANQVGTITSKVKEATDAAKGGKKLDLTEAAKAADALKETGVKIVEIKQRIDLVRQQITDDERKEYAEGVKKSLNDAFAGLLTQKKELREALAAAEVYDKSKVDELRKRIVEAEGPFEAQARN
jgi:L-fucose isomerase-like protein